MATKKQPAATGALTPEKQAEKLVAKWLELKEQLAQETQQFKAQEAAYQARKDSINESQEAILKELRQLKANESWQWQNPRSTTVGGVQVKAEPRQPKYRFPSNHNTEEYAKRVERFKSLKLFVRKVVDVKAMAKAQLPESELKKIGVEVEHQPERLAIRPKS